VEGPPNPVEAVNRSGNQGASAGNFGEPNPGINRVDTPQAPQAPQVNPVEGPAGKQPVQGPNKWDTVKTDNGLRKGVDPGITRGDTPPQFNPKGKQPVQGARKWDTVKTDGGLRHEISPGALTDEASGYNKMAVKQELYGVKDGKPVPGRNKVPDLAGGDPWGLGGLDGTTEGPLVDIHRPPPGLEEIGAEFTDTVDGTFDELIKGARKKSPEKKMFKALKPEVKTVEKGWTKILNVVNTAWDTLWDTIFWPFKQAWKWIKSLAAKIAKWLGIVAKGSTVFSKVALGSQKVFTAIKGKYDIPVMSRVFFVRTANNFFSVPGMESDCKGRLLLLDMDHETPSDNPQAWSEVARQDSVSCWLGHATL
jgi:hypothetical protein